ncbi:unnamed protein product [Scytosiphon promiscuus]
MLLLLDPRRRVLPRTMSSAHACLLAFLIGSGFTQSPSPVSVAAFPSSAAARRPTRAPGHRPSRNNDDRLRTTRRLSSPLTRLHARRGGKGRRRGRAQSDGAPSVAGGAATAAVRETPPTASAAATLAVQHAAHHVLLGVAYDNRALLRPAVLSQALLRIAKPLVRVAKQAERDALLHDPRLHAVFMAASAPAAIAGDDTAAPAPAPAPTGVQALSGPQAADIVWACGLLRWLPQADNFDGPEGERGGHEGAGGAGRLAGLVRLVARAASSRSGIDDGHVTNVLWALERLGVPTQEVGEEIFAGVAGIAGGAAAAAATAQEVVPEGDRERGGAGDGGGSADGGVLLEGNWAVEELRKRVEGLPFRAIPSLFEGLRVEDFREEVAFGRDEILLGGGKVLSESRLTAWQSSDGIPFAYSGKVMEPAPFSPSVLRLRDALYERTGVLYDGVLLNLYESRSSAMRYHSDPDVGTLWTQDTSVVSVGDTRQFALRQTLDHSRGRHAFYLSSGDCVRMTEGCQRDYQHCVKVAKEDVGPRISLVFKQSISGAKRRSGEGVAAVVGGADGGGEG